VDEIGGRPDEIPDEYAKRSVFSVLPGLTGIPIAIFWSRLDIVAPRQESCHGKHLYDELKSINPHAPVTEYDWTAVFDPALGRDDFGRWAIHESADYALAVRWLLLHRRWQIIPLPPQPAYPDPDHVTEP
jgi:hypothetical protein